MAGFVIPQNLLLGGGLFFLGLFVFVMLYIISRLLAERKGHVHHKETNIGHTKETGVQDDEKGEN
jgi:hypothetical protein